MNTVEPSSTSSSVSVHTEQPVSLSQAEEKDLTTNFYIVGGVINEKEWGELQEKANTLVEDAMDFAEADKRKGR